MKRAQGDLSRSADLDAAVIKASQRSCSTALEIATEAPQCGVETRAALGLALYRAGARSILQAAVSAVQAMVDDSAPLPEAHKAVSSVHFQSLASCRWQSFYCSEVAFVPRAAGTRQQRCPVVRRVPVCDQTCRSTRFIAANWLVYRAARGAITSNPHAPPYGPLVHHLTLVAYQAYPTTDLAVASVPTLASWLPRAIDERLLPEFEQRFCLSPVSDHKIETTSSPHYSHCTSDNYDLIGGKTAG